MKIKKVLITGASITGPTLAYWLHHYGFAVTVVERASKLRLGGQNIDVKGPAWAIAQKMGLEENIRAANTTEIGIRFVNGRNQTLAEFPKENALSMTQELEILRGDLVQILYERTKNNVCYRFGDSVSNLMESENHLAVNFASGHSEDFDLLIVAEGIGSHTRQLAFSHPPNFKFLNLYTAYLTISKAATDSRWARWYNAPGGVVFILRPDNYGETRASITFFSRDEQYRDLTLAEQKKVLIDRIKGTDWESERLVKEIERTTDLYFDKVSQVKASRWSTGRVALVGDAAYCATPIAGKGTDLAMAGAYILAGELSRGNTYAEAFQAYEQRMRPYVEKCQKLPPGVPSLVYPTSRLGVGLLNSVYRLLGSGPVQWTTGLFSQKKNPEMELELPDYNQSSGSEYL
ncbi:FAD-dependent monooxygenase [Adhaeribacter pallidiroseus]|uniref:Unspecific monooxygenase n=1 Tax=Adhaeribacter pallidiroseus TaxID=2072847 RepID=A0A369QC09_9BACT|nr:FAD-dependent monooxygenase [Adhaeribacter pallidiroseus]RDC62431.1 Unspecific monooxygenase [Adhaeribacter pallidiroseus]